MVILDQTVSWVLSHMYNFPKYLPYRSVKPH